MISIIYDSLILIREVKEIANNSGQLVTYSLPIILNETKRRTSYAEKENNPCHLYEVLCTVCREDMGAEVGALLPIYATKINSHLQQIDEQCLICSKSVNCRCEHTCYILAHQ
ncbi:hypothetical protein P3S68_023600 [Capsicum galapagoense]